MVHLLLPRITQLVDELVGVALLDLLPQRLQRFRVLGRARGVHELPVELVDAEPLTAVALQPVVERLHREIQRGELAQQFGGTGDSRVELPVAIDPHAALPCPHYLGNLARGDGLLGHRTREVADDLLVGLLEQVDRHQVTEARVLDHRGVVEVACRALGERGERVLAAPVVPQTREVELDVLQTTRPVRLEAVDGLAEDPQHQIVDARRR